MLSNTAVCLFALLATANAAPSLSLEKRAKPWHYGAWYNKPYDVSKGCTDIGAVNPDLLANWGNNNGHDGGIGVCGNGGIKFMPNMWGRPQDASELAKIPNNTPPWGIMLENEPNWRGRQPLNQGGEGANKSAAECATRYVDYKKAVDSKWGGVGKVRIISPSPVNRYYPACKPGDTPGLACYYQSQLDWLKEYFSRCNCLNDMYAINVHDYSCDVSKSQVIAQDIRNTFPGKQIFFGELGCNMNDPTRHANYLKDFAKWARDAPDVVGFMWSAINWVDTPYTTLYSNGALTQMGQAFKQVQSQFPPAN